MAMDLKLHVRDATGTLLETTLRGPIAIGRQQAGDPEPAPIAYLSASAKAPARIILFNQQANNVSRRHIVLEPQPSGEVRVTNGSKIMLVHVGFPSIPPQSTCDLQPPFTLELEERLIEVTRGDSGDVHGLHKLEQATVGPEGPEDLATRILRLPKLDAPHLDVVIRWLQTTMGVLLSTLVPKNFLQEAIKALLQIARLHSGRVLLREGNAWKETARVTVPGLEHLPVPPSQRVLDWVLREARTYWQRPTEPAMVETASLQNVEAAVAAPILGTDRKVLGVLYGERFKPTGLPPSPIGKIEAIMVELLACGIAIGLARLQQEQEASEARVRFEQFFTADLARHLAMDPDLLKGREVEVTLLFTDLRGFSAISHGLDPATTMAWITDVLSVLSDCVLAEEGVLVDYIGDALLAMWGAPKPQADHATRAVRAALSMIDTLPRINERWEERLRNRVDLGIGINTGKVQVGNIGSKQKFKYGPLGDAVNVASRVEGLTKFLHCPILATAATCRQLKAGFFVRRLFKTRVVNIRDPIEICEVKPYMEILERLGEGTDEIYRDVERGEYTQAARVAGSLLNDYGKDGPLLILLAEAAKRLSLNAMPGPFIWEPPGK